MTTRAFVLAIALLSASHPAFAETVANDRINRAAAVSSLPFQDDQDTSTATTAMNDPACVGQGPTVWFKYRASRDGVVTANTFGSDYDTTLSVYTFTPGRMLTQIACNDDYDNLQSAVVFEARAGVTYYMMVGAFASGPGGQLVFSMEALDGHTPGAVQVAVNSVSLNPSTGQLLVAGTASCSGPASGYIFGDVTQKRTGGAIRAFFGVDVVCSDTGTWMAISGAPLVVRSGGSSATVEFRRATAVVSARAWMWNGTTGEVSEAQTVSRVRVY